MKKILLTVVTAFLIAAMTFVSASAATQRSSYQDNPPNSDSRVYTPPPNNPRPNNPRPNTPRPNNPQPNIPRDDSRLFPYEVLRLVNIEREKIGASPLRFADDLASSAYIRARELPQKFSHTRPDGSRCFTAMPKRGHVLGENLAGGHTSPQQVVEAWMKSEGHRANILNENYSELGVVYYYQPNSQYRHYWVQHFRG